MSWEQSTVNGPISDTIKSALTPVSNALGAIAPVLATASALLGAAKPFLTGSKDAFTQALGNLTDQLQDTINDAFGTGFFLLTVNPFKMEGIRKFDSFGTPLMTPGDIIDEMIASFDDLGDANRPQFSDSASVSAFGLIATSQELVGLLDLIRELIALFNIPEWELILTTHERQADDTFVKSKIPDWESVRLNSFEPFASAQKDLNRLLEAVTQVIPDDNLADLVSLLEEKVNRAQALTDKIREVIDGAAGSASGLFVFDLDTTVGGNNKIKEELRDPYLEQCVPNGYSIGSLFVGGGPVGAAAVQSFKDLMVREHGNLVL